MFPIRGLLGAGQRRSIYKLDFFRCDFFDFVKVVAFEIFVGLMVADLFAIRVY